MKRYHWYGVIGCTMLASGFLILLQPNRFQKWNSIRPTQEYHGERLKSQNRSVGIDTVLTNIPYPEEGSYVYTVLPSERYRHAVLEGNGDCSNKSYGFAYLLNELSIDFEIVHFLPKESLFTGRGHVVVRVPYDFEGMKGVGLLDLAGGGVPTVGDRPVDYSELKDRNTEVVFRTINDAAPEYYATYYEVRYLNDVELGFTAKEDVVKYFNFVESFYVPLHNAKLEKYFYDGLAVLLGKYYSIYVAEEFLKPFVFEMYLFKVLLLLVRLQLIAIGLIIVYELSIHIRRFTRQRRATA